MTLENKKGNQCMVKDCPNLATDALKVKVDGQPHWIIMICATCSDKATIETYSVRSEVMRWRKA